MSKRLHPLVLASAGLKKMAPLFGANECSTRKASVGQPAANGEAERSRRQGIEQLTVQQVAAICQVHPKTVRKWIKSRELRATRKGRVIRVALEDLKEFLDRNCR